MKMEKLLPLKLYETISKSINGPLGDSFFDHAQVHISGTFSTFRLKTTI